MTSPSTFIVAIATSGGSGDPAQKTMRSEDKSQALISCSPSASIRWNMIGTTRTVVARCVAMSSRNWPRLPRKARLSPSPQRFAGAAREQQRNGIRR
jgi:hypothetical protein